MSPLRALCAVCALFLGLGAALRWSNDLFGVILRFANQPTPPEPEWLAQAVSVLFIAGAVLTLPVQIRMAADRSDAGRPWLFAGIGPLIAAGLIVVALVILAETGGANMLMMAGIRFATGLGEMTGALPVLLLLTGLMALAGHQSAAAGALLAAPLAILAALAVILEVGITGSTLSASLPLILCAAALLPAVIVTKRAALMAWPVSAALIAGFAVTLLPGLVTPSELTALLLVPAIAAGIIGLVSAPPAGRGAWLERATAEIGGLVLALLAVNLMAMLLVAVPWIIDAKRMLAGVMPSAMLALTFIAYIVVAAFAGPMVAIAIVLILIVAAYGAGVPADILVVGLTVAALQTMVTRGTARQTQQPGDGVVLPPRQAAWAQTLIMIIVTALAVAAILGWV